MPAPPILSHPSELIVAPATVPGSGARAIVRLSGEGLARLLGELFEPITPAAFASQGPPRCVAARLGAALAATWGPLPVEVLWWPGPAGPTGGPLAELQLPVSAPLVDAIVAAACRHGARLARGGEFSLRAFLAGRLDLLQAEAVLGVVEARTPADLSLALDRMAGGAGRRLRDVREQLLDLLADIEAVIDFSDEHSPDHVAADDAAFWRGIDERLADASRSLADVATHLVARDAAAGDLPRVVIVGRPNVGKSSLFNSLVGSAAALVADESGTTRDWVGARLDDGVVACLLVDCAGIDGALAGGSLDGAVADAAAAEIARADVLVVCRDVEGEAVSAALPADVPRLDVVTRCDRAPTVARAGSAVATSSRTGLGIEALRRAILDAIAAVPGRGSAATLRMRVGVDAAGEAIAAARTVAGQPGRDEALVAGHLGGALAALGAITGIEMAPDLLDRIFHRHCIGK